MAKTAPLRWSSAIAPVLMTCLIALVFVRPVDAQNASPEDTIPARFLPIGGYTPPSIAPFRPDAGWTDGPRPTTPSTSSHLAALRADSHHAKSFWVETAVLPRETTRTIVVIPQFHRSDTQPIDWTTLGGEIRDVQAHIDVLVTRLVVAHGLSCLGTEGSALQSIQTPMELKQLATWNRELALAHKTASAALVREGETTAGPMRTVHALLEDALRKRLVLLDGAGVALSRLPADARATVSRFGLEDLRLNNKAVALLQDITKIEEELALLEPSTQSTTADVMGVMWLDEFPAYQSRVLDPYDASIAALDVERKRLLNIGADSAADALRRFVSRSKHIGSALIRSDDVRGYHAYYSDLEQRALDEPKDAGPAPKKKRLRAAERKRKQALTKKRDKLWAKYEKTTIDAREAVAATRILAALPKKPGGICAAVMGANHSEGLIAALQAKAPKDVGVVVVAPFHFD